MKQNFKKGSADILVLTIGVVAMITLGTIVMLVSFGYERYRREIAYNQTLAVAEAGANYYRWHLAHAPIDYTDGTGNAGPYVHDYKDPEGNVVGKFSLTVAPPEPGYSQVTITSTAWMLSYPSLKRTVVVEYGIPSLARYSFLHNANVWFGQGLTVHGRVMSNGGIRQDGVNDSVIQSLQQTYTCGSETGCGTPTAKPGVWGSGGPNELWQFPVDRINFDAISVDFATMKTAASSSGTLYEPSAYQGYHVVFQNDGTAKIFEVLTVGTVMGYDDGACNTLNQVITSENLLATVNLTNNQVLFFEDTVWVEGVVKGNAAVVAARFPFDTYNEDMWINNNITYIAKDDHNHLGLMAQRNIYFVKDIPLQFEIDAALLAKGGKIIRHNYGYWACQAYTEAVRQNLTIYGSVISSLKSYWNWGTGASMQSGFTTRNVTYDVSLYLEPPPYFPASGDYEIISWNEENHN
jgi:hypothetical protein